MADKIKEMAEELASNIHEKDMAPGPIGTTINFIGKTSDRIESALRKAMAMQCEEDAREADMFQVSCGSRRYKWGVNESSIGISAILRRKAKELRGEVEKDR